MDMKNLKFRNETPESDQKIALRFAEDLATDKKPVATNYSAFGMRKVDETSTGPVVEAIAVSEGIKRDGSTIQVKGIDLRNLKDNPVLMFGHNYSQPPIGRIVDFRKSNVEGLGKVLKIRFTPLKSQMDTEHKRFADSIFEMLVNQDLRSVSFGWRTLEAEPIRDADGYYTGYNFIRTDAMEVSVVPVPADPQALITSIRERGLDAQRFVVKPNERGIYEVREVIPDEFQAGVWLDGEDEIDSVPAEEARRGAGKPEDKKDETVMDLEAFMRKLEEKFGAQLTEKLGAIEKRMDEMPVLGENRKGAVLNSANRKALTDAMQLIAAVLRNAGPGEADGDADTGKSAAKPEETRKPDATPDPVVDVKFEDVADIHAALKARRADNAEKSTAADILGALALRAKARSKN